MNKVIAGEKTSEVKINTLPKKLDGEKNVILVESRHDYNRFSNRRIKTKHLDLFTQTPLVQLLLSIKD